MCRLTALCLLRGIYPVLLFGYFFCPRGLSLKPSAWHRATLRTPVQQRALSTFWLIQRVSYLHRCVLKATSLFLGWPAPRPERKLQQETDMLDAFCFFINTDPRRGVMETEVLHATFTQRSLKICHQRNINPQRRLNSIAHSLGYISFQNHFRNFVPSRKTTSRMGILYAWV